ncbi:MAG: hypothetical protein ACE5JX_04250 [Acidobacteriota bacterium]
MLESWGGNGRAECGRHLVICLDGVSYADFHALQSEGHFPYLKPASRLIAPFPSLTNPAMVEILGPAGAPPAQGYQDHYYSRRDNALKGGIRQRLSSDFVGGSFRRIFDYHPTALRSSFEYLAPPYSCRASARENLRDGLKAFRQGRERFFTLYIGPTDCAAHTGGRHDLKRLLIFIDRELAKLAAENLSNRISLFSDHGNAYGHYRRLELDGVLEKGGYRVEKKIESEKSVVLPLFGLVGSAAIHAHAEQALAIARLVARTEGVHLACVKQGDTIFLYSGEGEARIQKQGRLLSYTPGPSDPLDLRGYALGSVEEWFERTRDHRYPDAVNRLWTQSEAAVVNHATVLVSFKPGFYSGSRLLDFFVSLKATHGSLDRDQSLGFIVTSDRTLPRWIRSQEAWQDLLRLDGTVRRPVD